MKKFPVARTSKWFVRFTAATRPKPSGEIPAPTAIRDNGENGPFVAGAMALELYPPPPNAMGSRESGMGAAKARFSLERANDCAEDECEKLMNETAAAKSDIERCSGTFFKGSLQVEGCCPGIGHAAMAPRGAGGCTERLRLVVIL